MEKGLFLDDLQVVEPSYNDVDSLVCTKKPGSFQNIKKNSKLKNKIWTRKLQEKEYKN